MRAIRSKNTKPELIVRRLVRQLGYGYRLHRNDLPGRPDLAFIGRRKAIFVHGCFWHQHDDPHCPLAKRPKSRPEYWGPKFERNLRRDQANRQRLEASGWQVLVIWECQLRDEEALLNQINMFLAPDG